MTTQEEVGIKVHCIVSCLCEVIRRETKLDYRPMYIGLWDADFDVTAEGEFTYYQHDLDHSHYYVWFERLFGAPVIPWYNASNTPIANLDTLTALLEEDRPERYVMAQIDMSYMPERENKFYQKPFPHFVILQKTADPERWFMLDPDFRWEGIVEKAKVTEAILKNDFGGGFYVDAATLAKNEAKSAEVDRYYREVFTFENRLTSILQTLIPKIALEQDGYKRNSLIQAVRQLPVLAIRKYSYEHALMYFIEHTGADDSSFEAYCDLIEQLVQGFHNVQYLCIKMSMTGRIRLLDPVLRRLKELQQLEMRIKEEVHRLYRLWRSQHQPDGAPYKGATAARIFPHLKEKSIIGKGGRTS